MSGWKQTRLLVSAVLFVSSILLLLWGTHWFEARCPPKPASSENATQVTWLYGANVVTQRLYASYNGLSKISLRLGHPPADGALFIMFSAADTEAPGNAWGAQVSGDGGVYTLSFPPQHESAGKEYLLTLHAPTAPNVERTSLWVTPHDNIPGELLLNGMPAGGDMVIKLCYRPKTLGEKSQYTLEHLWDHYNDLDTLLNRLSQYKPFFFKRPQWLGLLTLNVAALSWLCIFLWGQTFRRSPWSVRYSLRLSLQLDLLAIVIFTAVGLWSGRFGSITELRAQPTNSEITPSAGSTLVYDFAYRVSSDPSIQVDSPEDGYVAYDWAAVGPNSRPVLKMHPPSSSIYTMMIPEDAWLRGAAALHPDVWSPEKGDGVLFQIQVLSQNGEETLYYNQIDPKNIPDHRRWHDFEISLDRFAGQQVTLKFLTFPMNSSDWDWALWGEPVLITKQN